MQFLTVDECLALCFGLHGVAFLRSYQMLDNAFERQNQGAKKLEFGCQSELSSKDGKTLKNVEHLRPAFANAG